MRLRISSLNDGIEGNNSEHHTTIKEILKPEIDMTKIRTTCREKNNKRRRTITEFEKTGEKYGFRLITPNQDINIKQYVGNSKKNETKK